MDASRDEQLVELAERLRKLERRPKDRWDRAQVVAAFLVPLAVAFAGNQYATAMKQAELDLATIRGDRDHQIARANSLIGQANLIATLMEALAGTDAKRQKLATQAVLLAMPETGPALVRVLSESDEESVVQFAGEALSGRREPLIEQLFSSAAADRIEAYNALLSGWRRDASIVPQLIAYARQNRSNENGVYNTLVLLSHMNADALKGHGREIEAFSKEAEGIGARTTQRAEVLRSRLQRANP